MYAYIPSLLSQIRCGEYGVLVHVGGDVNWYSHYREYYGDSLKKLKVELPYDPDIYLFIWLSWVLAPAHRIFDLLCSMRGFQLWPVNSVVACGIQFPDQGLNSGLLHSECEILAIGPLGKSRETEQTSSQRRHKNGQHVHIKVLSITNHWRNANQSHN